MRKLEIFIAFIKGFIDSLRGFIYISGDFTHTLPDRKIIRWNAEKYQAKKGEK